MSQSTVIRQPGSATSLTIGFAMCLALTIGAYFIMKASTVSLELRIGLIAGLAFVQFIVQLVFFLHLGREKKPRWKFWMFIAMIMVVSIVVTGSLWIMHNLDYNMLRMSPEQENTYVKNNEGL